MQKELQVLQPEENRSILGGSYGYGYGYTGSGGSWNGDYEGDGDDWDNMTDWGYGSNGYGANPGGSTITLPDSLMNMTDTRFSTVQLGKQHFDFVGVMAQVVVLSREG